MCIVRKGDSHAVDLSQQNLDPHAGPYISKYLDPPELIFQNYTEINGPPLKLLVPPKSLYR